MTENGLFILMVENELANEDIMEYHELIDWAYKNLNDIHIVVFKEDDIDFMEESGILDIINRENDSLIGFYGTGSLFENEIKIRIKTKLESKISTFNLNKEDRNLFVVSELMRLLNLSILTKRHLRFWF